MSNQKLGLRIAWIIPNVLMYMFFLVLSIFVFYNADGLDDINRLSIWLITLILLLFISLFGSFRIWSWIKQGKL
ncbi:hypothetical protein [Paenibacillus sp. Soil787]|uniref:hypothetical protein n=1 Tax=Paenibacillus sp. Soil787 TaxID=1736411 RepID=UPI000702E0FD|nr:hypothetical protein [Paenibacillus sp. Soil787]KRF20194.1 hypothetical protein ASG93_31265 [Paenibacillus sp. Soil787]